MGKVIDFLSRSPHMAGKAVCLSCAHSWEAVAPVGTLILECPECGLGKGAFKNLVAPETYWQCVCGNSMFIVGPDGCVCGHCGITQSF